MAELLARSCPNIQTEASNPAGKQRSSDAEAEANALRLIRDLKAEGTVQAYAGGQQVRPAATNANLLFPTAASPVTKDSAGVRCQSAYTHLRS